MSKNLIRSSKGGSKASQVEEEFMQYVAKNMDGRTFIMLNKYLNELRAEIEKAGKGVPINADFFLVFLDKVHKLTPSEHLNNLLISKLELVDVSRLGSKEMLNSY